MNRAVDDVVNSPNKGTDIHLTIDVTGDLATVRRAVRQFNGTINHVGRFNQLDVTLPEVHVGDIKDMPEVGAINIEGDVRFAGN